ncbi:hypothetical protein [Taibaiella lutea]|uniref:hypothetical protein n=1 Tax=Taibaiella lutea TaxID=2608001 RepID=UPI001C1236C1|nr:hypothetical protein [Taibaiella lutea]
MGTNRKVAIVGYNRIPFARYNTAYAGYSNQDLLVAALNGLVDKYKLHGQRLERLQREPLSSIRTKAIW